LPNIDRKSSRVQCQLTELPKHEIPEKLVDPLPSEEHVT